MAPASRSTVGKSRGFIRLACTFSFIFALALLSFAWVLQEDTRVLSLYNIQGNPSLRAVISKGPNDRGIVKAEPPGRKLVWLMSFPNSGTSFTSRLIRDLTQTDSASNYADETDAGRAGRKFPVFEDMPDGPFWVNKPESELDYAEPSEYVLTKTHCGIRCANCPPEKYIESTFSFRSNCLKTKWMDVNKTAGVSERVFSQYEPDRLTKVVHLIRDPFDNVVSRFHLEREIPGREAGQYSEDREGFRAYCKAIDSKHIASEKKVIFLSDSLLDILNRVPCHEDFIRYIEWHNLAFVTTRDMQLQTHILHYDWYGTRYSETTQELLNFLKLKKHKNGIWTPFEGNVYSDYYTIDEKLALAEAFKMMASIETWNHISQYFNDFQPQGILPKGELVPHRPTIDSLVKKGSKTEIIGDVQFLMDFAIVGYPKTATSAMTRWLASQPEIQMYDHEIYYLKNNEPAEMVRSLFSLPEGDQFKRGYKAPRDIHNPPAVQAFSKYFPKTKFIVGLRHPVLWFESFYNYRIRSNITLPSPLDMIGDCTPEMQNVCTEEIRYMDHLSAMGKTDRTDPEELKLLSPSAQRKQYVPMNNHVFLYEISQMEETDDQFAAQYRLDLQNYLGLSEPIGALTEEKESHDDSLFKELEIDICDPLYAPLHAELMDIAAKSSIWLRDYFLPLPDVHVSSPDRFNELIQAWLVDPCVARRND